jgi:hypothetical protein
MTANAEPFEKLGLFYLGKEHDLESGETGENLVLYDSRDLLTHALCVGMTGSGKTGLCVGLLEEAAIDGIPALILDPKGDLGNLLLTFPDLAPEDFAPWVDPADAQRQGITREELAASQAELWKKGLAKWGQDGERIRRLKAAADFTLYTPGSEAGEPISILDSLAPPAQEVRDDPDLLRQRIDGLTTGLLTLLGIDADPVQSREYILLASLLAHAWEANRELDLAGLIQAVHEPPLDKVGVMPLETFYPAKERFALAMSLNNLLASPTFQAWTVGSPLNIDRLLYTAEGKPRVAVVSLSHLGEAERMFMVTLILNEMVGWMRTRPGTSSLRAILYMDEIFGYLPPVAAPPSKKPMITLLKQARAFGVGVVLATQNPADLDYKALSNIGTWFLGRLQTERDKERVLDGLEGVLAAEGGLDRQRLSEILSGVGKRVFLLHNVHEERPVVFHTRWVLSYLRGPMTRQEIRRLKDSRPARATAASASAPAEPARRGTEAPSPEGGTRPLLPPEVPQVFLPVRRASPGSLIYEPRLLGEATVSFADRKRKVEASHELLLLAPWEGEDGDWSGAREGEVDPGDLEDNPEDPSSFASVNEAAADPKSYRAWEKDLAGFLYRERRLVLLESPSLGEVSQPGEDERDFRIRLGDLARERRDLEKAKLQKSYASKLERHKKAIDRAEDRLAREQQQASDQKMQAVFSLGRTVLAAFTGRKMIKSSTISGASSAARGFSRSLKESQDVARVQEDLEESQQALSDLEAELAAEIDAMEERIDPLTEVFETVEVKPRKSDIRVERVALAWVPMGTDASGARTEAYR